MPLKLADNKAHLVVDASASVIEAPRTTKHDIMKRFGKLNRKKNELTKAVLKKNTGDVAIRRKKERTAAVYT